MTDTPLLELRGVSKSFGSVQALTDVDFEVRRGEVMALVGDNGAGKSTLIKCIAGIHPMDEGELLFEGQPVTVHGPKDAAKLGIEVVYQDLALCDNLDVVQNTHNLHDIFETATRITVLRLGRNAGLFERAKVTQEQVVHAITAGQPTKVSGIPGTQGGSS